ncbi:MAG: hypothetical protein PHR15_04515 [Atopobiaceae bacterium]|jgi:hypothetical protein|nr:hypothetical protein [Atopobiaceae bacterium]MCH4180128.1 hypothetical protein [Atopobiaceae bacterium]MCH4213820.1 hypothetical protein [Atopobiaceae bacterium]MCH4229922.1 hypothetical protein [Atopobiaceae bacterium]MCH4275717.1 hypothetical protein [Atopobiaceae bacterium]
MAEKNLRARKASQAVPAGTTSPAGGTTPAATTAAAGAGRLSRLRTWARTFAASPAAAFLVGLVVVCAVALLVWWFVMDSGIGAPAGFVYQEY